MGKLLTKLSFSSVLESEEKAGCWGKAHETEKGTGGFQKNVGGMLYLLCFYFVSMQSIASFGFITFWNT